MNRMPGTGPTNRIGASSPLWAALKTATRRIDMSTQHTAVLATVGCLALACAAGARAGTYPDQPVRIVVPFSTGGGTDIQARLLADSFFKSMHQTFIVDNKPGASGLIGAEIATEAPADGYTILFTTATLAINPTLYGKRWTVDPLKELDPVGSTPAELLAQVKREMAKYGDVIRVGQIHLQ
jgi:hypothetical protein